jgi:beta propeller repeat protein
MSISKGEINMRIRLSKILAVTCVMFLLVGNMMSATAAITVTEKNLTATNADNCYWPEVSGNYVVYSDYPAGPGNVYLYNISADTTVEIGLLTSSNESPSIDGDRVVYTSNDGSQDSIRMYTISTASDIEICQVGHNASRPAISGDKIVYRNGNTTNGPNNIYLIDLTDVTLTPSQISGTYSRNFRPMIDGNYVVWHANNGTDNDVMLYDINAATETAIATTADDEEKPDVSGANVVYHISGGDGGIRLYNIDSHATTQIVDPGYAFTPRIDGNFMIYEGGLTGGAQKVIRHDLTTGAEMTIAEPGDFLDIPAIDGMHVVWVTNDGDIMLDTLSEDVPVVPEMPYTGR